MSYVRLSYLDCRKKELTLSTLFVFRLSKRSSVSFRLCSLGYYIKHLFRRTWSWTDLSATIGEHSVSFVQWFSILRRWTQVSFPQWEASLPVQPEASTVELAPNCTCLHTRPTFVVHIFLRTRALSSLFNGRSVQWQKNEGIRNCFVSWGYYSSMRTGELISNVM